MLPEGAKPILVKWAAKTASLVANVSPLKWPVPKGQCVDALVVMLDLKAVEPCTRVYQQIGERRGQSRRSTPICNPDRAPTSPR